MKGPRRLKNFALLATIVVSGLTLLTWTGQWFSLTIAADATGSSAKTTVLAVSGDVAAPGLIALALAGLALTAALAIAGPVFRFVLGALQVLLGVTIAGSSIVAFAHPIRASESVVTAATGVSGSKSVAALVTAVSESAWPYLAAIVGVLTVAVGVFVLLTGRRWPGSSRKYQAVTLEPSEVGENPVSDWDSLSGGSDPTSR